MQTIYEYFNHLNLGGMNFAIIGPEAESNLQPFLTQNKINRKIKMREVRNFLSFGTLECISECPE